MALYDGLKDAANVLKEAGKIEQYRQILETQEKLLEMQKKIIELEAKNKELCGQLEINSKLFPRDNMYYMEKDGSQDGPFCTSCWDGSHKLIRLHISRDFGSATCPACKIIARPGRAIVTYPRENWRNSAR